MIQKNKIIKFIGLGGGPCAGKSSVIATLCEEALSLGYLPLVNHEIATELHNMGVWFDKIDPLEFQRVLMRLLIYKENMLREVAQMSNYDKIVVICDRGIIDSKAYLKDKEQYKALLEELCLNELEANIRYDKLLFLNSLAVAQPLLYMQLKETNKARHESVQQAREMNALSLEACNGHDNLRIITNDQDVERLLFLAKKELRHTLGEPVALDKQKKFVIKKPNIQTLSTQASITRLQITQTYLTNDGHIIRRVRKISNGEHAIYNSFQQEPLGPSVHLIRKDIKISEEEYRVLLKEAHPDCITLVKNRLCFIANDQSFRLDIFETQHENMALATDHAMLEVDYHAVWEEINLPDFITVLKEVTDDERFQNYNLAKK